MLLDRPEKTESNTRHEFLLQFQKKAKHFLEGRGVPFLGAEVFDWESTEDPTWKQKVLAIKVASDADTALTAWEDLEEQFLKAINANPSSIRDSLLEGVTFEIVWGHAS